MSQLRSGLEPLAFVRRAPLSLFFGARVLPSASERVSTAAALVSLATVGWIALFGWLGVARHLAFGSHAEDLGFTDQVIWNFLRGQWFRMSVYPGASAWNTELDLAHLARPDSLLAFHVEPMLLRLRAAVRARRGAGPAAGRAGVRGRPGRRRRVSPGPPLHGHGLGGVAVAAGVPAVARSASGRSWPTSTPRRWPRHCCCSRPNESSSPTQPRVGWSSPRSR